MSVNFDLDLFRATPLVREPFQFLVVPQFIREAALERINADYPAIAERGSFPVNRVAYGPAFQSLLDELESDEFRNVFEQKFQIDLSGRPTTTTVRGWCDTGDGKIHTDSRTKIITVLLYMNDDSWESSTGRLRLLRNDSDLENYAAEVEPSGGTLLIFKRSDSSWHGHHPFEGKRRAIQLNWVTDQAVVDREQGRHGFSSKIKRLFQPAHWMQ